MDTDFAAIGRLLAAPARSSMLGLLFDGEEHVAGELAASAGVRASTASEHLAALVSGGLVTVRTGGRHRHYSLGSPAVAEALELLGHLCPTTEIRSLRQSRALTALASARTCYDHLAGRLGVDLLDSLVVKNWLRLEPLEITERGEAGLADLGIQLDELRLRRRRPLLRTCADWTERRPHLAGSVGAALTTEFLNRGWVRRHHNDRSIRVTDEGVNVLSEVIQLDLSPTG